MPPARVDDRADDPGPSELLVADGIPDVILVEVIDAADTVGADAKRGDPANGGTRPPGAAAAPGTHRAAFVELRRGRKVPDRSRLGSSEPRSRIMRQSTAHVLRTLAPIAAIMLATTACAGEPASRADSAGATADSVAPAGTAASVGAGGASTATATVRDSGGRELGRLDLSDSEQGITVSGRLTGVPPGEHAIHVHTTGRCDAPSFDSAGDHWNPTTRQHGTQNPQGPHLGDMPNVTAAADSTVGVQVVTPGGTLRGANALLDADGAAIVVHAGPDDHRTDPSGNSGARIACGVITPS